MNLRCRLYMGLEAMGAHGWEVMGDHGWVFRGNGSPWVYVRGKEKM